MSHRPSSDDTNATPTATMMNDVTVALFLTPVNPTAQFSQSMNLDMTFSAFLGTFGRYACEVQHEA